MGLADAMMRNYAAMAKFALPAGFTVGLVYSLAFGTSPLSDAKQAAFGTYPFTRSGSLWPLHGAYVGVWPASAVCASKLSLNSRALCQVSIFDKISRRFYNLDKNVYIIMY